MRRCSPTAAEAICIIVVLINHRLLLLLTGQAMHAAARTERPGNPGAWIRDGQLLRAQINALEKEKRIQFYSKKSELKRDLGVLEEYELKLLNDRKSEELKLQQQLNKLKTCVLLFQKELKDVAQNSEFVNKLKGTMEEVERTISFFKEQQRELYEHLMKDEKMTSQEIGALEKKIESWSQGSLSNPRITKSAVAAKVPLSKTIEDDLPAEVVAFEKFLQQSGGRQGGWDDYDHQNFLKVRTRHKGNLLFIEEALNYLPGRTREDVEQHETWYKEFLDLEDEKKEAISRWKLCRERERAEKLAKQEKSSEGQDAEKKDQEEAWLRKLKQEQFQKREKINAWKAQQEKARADEEKRRQHEEEERARHRERETQRQAELRVIAGEHVRRKRQLKEQRRRDEELRAQAERKDKARLAAQEIQRFQERDQEKVESKLLEKKAKEQEDIERDRRLAKLKQQVDVHVERDPSRLLKLTKGWLERTKHIGPSGGGPLLTIPHRAVPDWRQGL